MFHKTVSAYCTVRKNVSRINVNMQIKPKQYSLFFCRYQNLEDMVEIIPGLDKKGQYGFSRENNESHQSLDYDGGSQNPTIIL